MTTTLYTINDIQREMREDGSHWWDPDTMRMFGTKVVSPVYQGDGGIYFVTRDKAYDGSLSHTVRKYDPTTKEVDTVGDLCDYRDKRPATKVARNLAGKNAAEAPQKLQPITEGEQFHADCQKHGYRTAKISQCDMLRTAGKRHHRYMEEYCNGRELFDADGDELPPLERCRKLIHKLASAVGAGGVKFSGDPRGCTVKLIWADGATDDFGKEGWCVPGA